MNKYFTALRYLDMKLKKISMKCFYIFIINIYLLSRTNFQNLIEDFPVVCFFLKLKLV